ncbi:MAG: polysaccharide biosynthesis C-terminal domain-containing protein [Clostridia bacterium]|nr:polysaccharide biosynthesis C-terminal domain-containing protein [Clostridia bacterium]
MNKYKKLLSNTLLISLGTFGSKLLVFFMVRFYTGYLTPSDYSTADLISQTANLLFPIISLGITDGVFRFAMDKDINRKETFSSAFFTITLGSLMFLVAVPILGLFGDFKGYIWLIVLYTMTCSYHSLCAQYIRAVDKTVLFAVQGIVNTCLVIALNILFLAVFDMGVTGYVLSVAAADFICTVFLVIKEKLWQVMTFKIPKSVTVSMLKYSIPLIPTTVFWWITSVSDRYMVNGFISSEANGIYAVSYKLPTLLTLVSGVFMKAWQFSAVSEEGDNAEEHAKFFERVWGSFQAVMFIAGSGVIAFAKPLMKMLTASEYYSAWEYVPLLSVSMVFTSFVSFLGTVYIVKKKSGLSFATSTAGAMTNIVLNLLLIPSPLGVQGAAVATAASYFIVFVIRAVNVRKYIPFNLDTGHIILNSIILLIQAAVMIFNVPFWIVIQAVCLVLLTALNFRFLLGFVRKILKRG